MNFQFTHPGYLLLLIPAAAWVIWLFWTSDVHISRVRRVSALVIRCLILLALVFALAGLQWKKSIEGMNVYFLLDRSDSIPSAQQEFSLQTVNRMAEGKEAADRAGAIVFGAEPGIEATLEANEDGKLRLEKVQSVVGSQRTDIAGAIRLGTAAFPETGQKRLVLFSDGNENTGEALAAVVAARPLGVTMDVVPLGVSRGSDISLQKVVMPPRVKVGQTFEPTLFIHSDTNRTATVRIFRDGQHLGDSEVVLTPGKTPFRFPQNLSEAGFRSYDIHLDAPGDAIHQNNKGSAFVDVRGEPRILLITDDSAQDQELVRALQESRLEVVVRSPRQMPETLAEMQSFDCIFLSNVPAGDFVTREQMKLLESAVRDFGVGLVCIGGPNTYTAGGYRGTPLEEILPVSMELDSKKVLPSGALVLVMHGMEFNNGNAVAREIALGTLEALAPQDELGVILWDQYIYWLVPLAKVGNRTEMRRKIAGMNQGDLPGFEEILTKAHESLKNSKANVKHMIVFSDGDPAPPSSRLMADIVNDRITVSTVLISGHAGPETMIRIATEGNGRFWPITDPRELPQIFIKEAAVILKTAIYEEPFSPQKAFDTELTRGIAASDIPQLLGYVATSTKPRAETPLLTEKGDPLLAHWQFGLGRAVAFTSDARARWSARWLEWSRYRQFWTQIAQWSLRRLDSSTLLSEVVVEGGKGQIIAEAIDAEGNFRNFLQVQAVVVSPSGERQIVRLEQTGPGRYEVPFETAEEGVYTIHLMETEKGEPVASQTVGASINYSPEFSTSEPNMALLSRIAELGGGQMLNLRDPQVTPFKLNRQRTFQPRDLWLWLLRFAILAFPIDVAIRRVQLEREELRKMWAWAMRKLFFWKPQPRTADQEESLAALLRRRDHVRSSTIAAAPITPPAELFKPQRAVQPADPAPQAERSSPVAVEQPAEPKASPASGKGVSTTSRLLEAKRRVQKKPPDS